MSFHLWGESQIGASTRKRFARWNGGSVGTRDVSIGPALTHPRTFIAIATVTLGEVSAIL